MAKPKQKPAPREDAIREEMKAAADRGRTSYRQPSTAPNFRVSGRTPAPYSHGSTVIPDRRVLELNDLDFKVAQLQRGNPFLHGPKGAALASELSTLLGCMGEPTPGKHVASAGEALQKLSELAAATDDAAGFATLRDGLLNALLGDGTAQRVNDAIKGKRDTKGGSAR
jgi:hypothetical protein